MIIDVTGFGWSGSGAYEDLLKEYSELQYPFICDAEQSILYNVDGIKDLEFKLLEKHCRIFDSDIAIKRFFKLIDKLYNKRKVFKGMLSKESRIYIRNILGIKYKSRSVYDNVYLNSSIRTICNNYNTLIKKVIYHCPLLGKFKKYVYSLFCFSLKNDKYLSYNPDNFLNYTQLFMEKYLSFFRDETNRPLITNHLFPPDNVSEYFKYIPEDVKCIVVRRDPRDTYILAKEIYKGRIPIPVDTVQDFVWFYKRTIEETKVCNTNKVLNLNFEDIVYEYKKTKKDLETFLDIRDHVTPLKYFNPSISINNTQLYKKYRKYNDDIIYIQNNLRDSLFPFEKYSTIKHNSSTIY